MEIVDFGVGSKTFLMKRFARNGAFRGMEWQWAEWVLITNFLYLARAERTKLQGWRLEGSLTASRLFSGMSGQVEWKSEALELGPRLFNEALCP